MPLPRHQLTSFYKRSIQAANNFSDYNFKNYFIRKVNYDFNESKNAQNWSEKQLQENLDMLEKQSEISRMYAVEETVIEKPWVKRINN